MGIFHERLETLSAMCVMYISMVGRAAGRDDVDR